MTNSWHDIKPGTQEQLNVIIEIPKRSRVKYELDKETGLIKFDRVLYSPMHFPTNYGFVPQTLWEDGDPLDVLVMAHEELLSGSLIEVRPIGIFPMKDSGDNDAKILGVPAKDPRFQNTKNISDVEPHLLAEIKHFYSVYKELEGKKVEVGEWQEREAAEEAIHKAINLYKEKYSS